MPASLNARPAGMSGKSRMERGSQSFARIVRARAFTGDVLTRKVPQNSPSLGGGVAAGGGMKWKRIFHRRNNVCHDLMEHGRKDRDRALAAVLAVACQMPFQPHCMASDAAECRSAEDVGSRMAADKAAAGHISVVDSRQPRRMMTRKSANYCGRKRSNCRRS